MPQGFEEASSVPGGHAPLQRGSAGPMADDTARGRPRSSTTSGLSDLERVLAAQSIVQTGLVPGDRNCVLAPYPAEDTVCHVPSSRDQLPCIVKFKLDATLHASSLFATLNLALIPTEPLPRALIEVVLLRKPDTEERPRDKRRRIGNGGKGKGRKEAGRQPFDEYDLVQEDEMDPLAPPPMTAYNQCCASTIIVCRCSPSGTWSRSRTALCPLPQRTPLG